MLPCPGALELAEYIPSGGITKELSDPCRQRAAMPIDGAAGAGSISPL